MSIRHTDFIGELIISYAHHTIKVRSKSSLIYTVIDLLINLKLQLLEVQKVDYISHGISGTVYVLVE